MKGNLEEWAELLNLWPLVEHEAHKVTLSAHMKLTQRGDTADIGEVRLLQGKIEGIKTLLAIPRRIVAELEKKRKHEEKHDG